MHYNMQWTMWSDVSPTLSRGFCLLEIILRVSWMLGQIMVSRLHVFQVEPSQVLQLPTK